MITSIIAFFALLVTSYARIEKRKMTIFTKKPVYTSK